MISRVFWATLLSLAVYLLLLRAFEVLVLR